VALMKEEDYLEHYGILRKSGRYPWGSGNNVTKRSKDFLDMVADLKRQGLSDKEICQGFSTEEHPFTTTDLRAAKSIASNELRQAKINQAVKLRERGWSPTEIGKRMGVNESSVRGYLAAHEKDQADSIQNTAAMLMREVERKGVIDIGVGVEHALPLGGDVNPSIGVTNTKLQTAVAIAKENGYKVHRVPVPQLGSPGNFTRVKVLAKPDIEWKDIKNDPGLIKNIQPYTKDNGRNWEDEIWQPPIHVNSKRVGIIYAEDGGTKSDGVIFVRPGVKDLHMGTNNYSQVRISVDGTHYLKGMAVYKDGLPPGVDLMFNTNKSRVGNTKFDVLKPQSDDPDLPFGAVVRQLKDEHGKVNSALNIVNTEGQWDKWSKSLPSQMLSKQRPEVAKGQLDVTYERRQKEFDAIMGLTNSVVKKMLLEKFADGTDSAAVHLKAAAMPRQATKVILPIPSMKPNEVYAPSFRNGERVALVRFPHGGTFEIPQLVVNNKSINAKKTMGTAAKDAIGIHHTVAERLSGADFDGDTVLVIPNPRGSIKSTPPLEGLKGFDPRSQYKAYDGMKTVDGGVWNESEKRVVFRKGQIPNKNNMQHKMGDISNLITDMTIRGAHDDELARAVRHSMVVIDCEKHVLDYKQSYIDNGIPALKEKYQGGKQAGASTIISRAKSPKYIDARRERRASEGGRFDPETGERVFVPKEGSTYTNKKGEVETKKQRVKLLEVTKDAHELSSGTDMEILYADHSNKLKALANQARKESLQVPKMETHSSAKKVYAQEVASLNAKLLRAQKNAPLERQAQAIANSVVAQKRALNPHLEKAEEKKISNQALAAARIRTGARKERITLTQAEWDAIQAGAISTDKLEKILANAEIDNIRKLATPKPKLVMSSAKMQRARQMLADGYSQADVADNLGVALSTLKAALYED
jgi:predicted transcriptional regulator